ncbi:MAG: ribbon-helix-helix protein, CopG family [Deltaproteobacteria bacterium]|nr:ribbon-helix-helix protein, CopG family [Deltaproteobacteria bacterium]MBI4196258.1 ribbon-helix-helix protein, CopG family [Deltaproteobacteria bacterium]
MSKTISTSISLPLPLEKAVQKEARAEHRTKSGFIQEAIRYYLEAKRWKRLQRETAERARQLGIRSEEDVEELVDSVRT